MDPNYFLDYFILLFRFQDFNILNHKVNQYINFTIATTTTTTTTITKAIIKFTTTLIFIDFIIIILKYLDFGAFIVVIIIKISINYNFIIK
jgi:hypothetical protein